MKHKHGDEQQNHELNAGTDQSNSSLLECDKCDQTFKGEASLSTHKNMLHKAKLNLKILSKSERTQNGYCVAWNHGQCKHEDLCHFRHEEAPYCPYQNYCEDRYCQLYHVPSRHHFLGLGRRTWRRNRVL